MEALAISRRRHRRLRIPTPWMAEDIRRNFPAPVLLALRQIPSSRNQPGHLAVSAPESVAHIQQRVQNFHVQESRTNEELVLDDGNDEPENIAQFL